MSRLSPRFFQRWPALAAALLLFASAAVHGADAPRPEGDGVIYPRNSPNSTSRTGRSEGDFPLTGVLCVVVLLAGGGFYLLRRGGYFAPRPGAPGVQRLAIEETRPLGNKQFLAVAAYGERKFLLSVCPGRIELLTDLDAGAPPKPPA